MISKELLEAKKDLIKKKITLDADRDELDHQHETWIEKARKDYPWKYEIGQAVIWRGTGVGVVIDRRVDSSLFDNHLEIGYKVAKMTKSGKAHKSHCLYWGLIEEDKLEAAK